LTLAERSETDDFRALVSFGKSCFAEPTTALAFVWIFSRSALRVSTAPLSSLTLLSSSTEPWRSLT